MKKDFIPKVYKIPTSETKYKLMVFGIDKLCRRRKTIEINIFLDMFLEINL